jgi:hypothetical protein
MHGKLHFVTAAGAWLEGFVLDLRRAVRALCHDRAFAVTTIAILAVAIALNVTAFTVMDAILFRGLPGHAGRPARLPCLAEAVGPAVLPRPHLVLGF